LTVSSSEVSPVATAGRKFEGAVLFENKPAKLVWIEKPGADPLQLLCCLRLVPNKSTDLHAADRKRVRTSVLPLLSER